MKFLISFLTTVISISMLAPTLASGNHTEANFEEVVRCESNDGNRKYCPANTRDGVYLKYQRSKSGCWQGETWGYDNNGIWVDRGCRADFAVGGSDSGGMSTGEKVALGITGAVITGAIISAATDDDDDYYQGGGGGGGWGGGWDRVKCESGDMDYRFCRTGYLRDVRIRRQISGSPCRRGYSWGSRRDGIWVNHGCRAEFDIRH